jgi:hypothetical protein
MEPEAMALFIPILGILVGAFALFIRSHLGHALADRIAGRTGESPAVEAEVRELRAEVETLRGELTETQERLDFTERMLSGGTKAG